MGPGTLSVNERVWDVLEVFEWEEVVEYMLMSLGAVGSRGGIGKGADCDRSGRLGRVYNACVFFHLKSRVDVRCVR